MRAPVRAVHEHVVVFQAARERVVLVIHAMLRVSPDPGSCNQNHPNNDGLGRELERTRSLRLLARLPPSFSLFRHLFPYTTTFSAEGSTSTLSQCKVSTSPSTITSTGASR